MGTVASYSRAVKCQSRCADGSSRVYYSSIGMVLALLVLRPVRKLAAIADQVSGSATGIKDAPDFPSKGNDEIALLGTSFNRMRRSLAEAIDMLSS